MWFTFRDPVMDHRLIIVGALLPDLIDSVKGKQWIAHTLLFPVGILFIVMLITIGRRASRRRLLALPIGLFWHLIFDASWTNPNIFWWPVAGVSFGDSGILLAEGSLGKIILLELSGVLSLMWLFKRFGLSDSQRRKKFVRTGRIDRSITEARMDK
tara:strand:- start:1200 stop:1667 length:468 start_codon:yes stop_codon:yes gene_type:complete